VIYRGNEKLLCDNGEKPNHSNMNMSKSGFLRSKGLFGIFYIKTTIILTYSYILNMSEAYKLMWVCGFFLIVDFFTIFLRLNNFFSSPLHRLWTILSTSISPRYDFWDIWSLLDNIFIYLKTIIQKVANSVILPIVAENKGLSYLIVILAMQIFFLTIILFIYFITSFYLVLTRNLLRGCSNASKVCAGIEAQAVSGRVTHFLV
jgi:hypothetical protein